MSDLDSCMVSYHAGFTIVEDDPLLEEGEGTWDLHKDSTSKGHSKINTITSSTLLIPYLRPDQITPTEYWKHARIAHCLGCNLGLAKPNCLSPHVPVHKTSRLGRALAQSWLLNTR